MPMKMKMMMMTKTFKDKDGLVSCVIIQGGGYCGGHGRTVNQTTHTPDKMRMYDI